MKPGEPVPMEAPTNFTGSFNLQQKQTDRRTVNTKGNKTSRRTAFVSILSPVRDNGKDATDTTREEHEKVLLNKHRCLERRIKVLHGKEETGTQGGVLT